MGCCIGAEHSNWCADYDVVYVDGEGEEYCIFHAPADCKFVEKYVEGVGEKPELISGEEFNELVFARIQAVIDAGEDEERNKWGWVDWNPRCNFAGTIFFADISFSEFNGEEGKYLPSINFISSQFRGSAYFISSQFRGDAYFSSSQFRGYAYFRSSQFRGDAYFRSIQFRGDAYFRSIQFRGDADFSSSQFRGYAYFRSIQFRGDADFSSSQFRGGGDFSDAELHKQIKFNDSIFHNMSFDNMEFKGPAYFDNVTFEEPVSFVRSIFHEYSNFEKAKFLEGAKFKHALFKEWTYFRNVVFGGKISFAGTISKEKILIEATNLSNMFFAETNIESFKFIECEWDKGEDGINLVYDEVNQEELKTKNSTLEEIYRRLKKVARENADEEQTSAWHYKEKEMKKREADSAFFFPAIITTFLTFVAFLICCGLLESTAPYYSLIVLIPTALAVPFLLIQNQYKKFELKYNDVPKSKKWFSKIYLNIYYWISGYGENPLRAGVLLVALIALPFMINFFTGFKDGADWVKHAIWYMPLLKVQLSDGIRGIQYFWKGVSVSLITIQAALFAFALRNKLRR
ncbi:pentapeptide repeat-containing protein [Desulfovibrio gilichinskyi]|uniref:Pentapeptide repeat-containing protein n=1 Tax=Desulfovibrio gilichinskyi TaxID=1519643 RepID=A0A1X7CJI9_9BACT|nr:pentapeptide repeat-containing protein [Desulfovibrio gilichinskyi]SME97846.1 Pentapeptide repeat-containing protein [Desulfovibrio gilichinskyi]